MSFAELDISPDREWPIRRAEAAMSLKNGEHDNLNGQFIAHTWLAHELDPGQPETGCEICEDFRTQLRGLSQEIGSLETSLGKLYRGDGDDLI